MVETGDIIDNLDKRLGGCFGEKMLGGMELEDGIGGWNWRRMKLVVGEGGSDGLWRFYGLWRFVSLWGEEGGEEVIVVLVFFIIKRRNID